MARIEKFEDIEAWERARQLAKAVYAVTSEGKFARVFGLREQTAFDPLYKMATETGNIIGGFMKYLSKGINK